MKKKKTPVAEPSVTPNCPHCNKPLLWGRKKSTKEFGYLCKPCNVQFSPTGLTITAQERAIHILRKHLDSVWDSLDEYEQKLNAPKMTAKKAKELISTMQNEIMPISMCTPCPRCMEDGKPSINCTSCYGTGYRSNL